MVCGEGLGGYGGGVRGGAVGAGDGFRVELVEGHDGGFLGLVRDRLFLKVEGGLV